MIPSPVQRRSGMLYVYQTEQRETFPVSKIPYSHKITADLFDELAEHGIFNERGGELSQDDWDDAVAR